MIVGNGWMGKAVQARSWEVTLIAGSIHYCTRDVTFRVETVVEIDVSTALS